MDFRRLYASGKILFLVVGLCVGYISKAEGSQCLKEESLGDREGNTYYCEDETNTECCTENGQFSCCEPIAKKALREQLILWGCIAGAGILVSLGCCYFWRENMCCGSDVPLSQRCCCCRRKVSEEDRRALTASPEAGGSKLSKPLSASSWRGRDPFLIRDDDTPPPPFHYKPPTVGKY